MYFEGSADRIYCWIGYGCQRKQKTRITLRSWYEELVDCWAHTEMGENWDRSLYQGRESTKSVMFEILTQQLLIKVYSSENIVKT